MINQPKHNAKHLNLCLYNRDNQSNKTRCKIDHKQGPLVPLLSKHHSYAYVYAPMISHAIGQKSPYSHCNSPYQLYNASSLL